MPKIRVKYIQTDYMMLWRGYWHDNMMPRRPTPLIVSPAIYKKLKNWKFNMKDYEQWQYLPEN